MPDSNDVLIIDDDPRIVRALGVRLRCAGFKVRTAFNGAAGFSQATQGPPSAIVLDICMPELDGLSLLSMLKANEHTRNVPVIVLSANSFDRSDALDRGARCFMPKPYDPKALLGTIRSAIAEAPRAIVFASHSLPIPS